MISMTALRPALNAVIPHLPKAAGAALTRMLPFLPLALELATVLFKHRQKIGKVAIKFAVHTSIEIKKGTAGVVKTVPYLPKKMGKKLQHCLQFLPLALEIAKASYRKKGRRLNKLTSEFPNEVKQKVSRTLNKYQCSCCTNLFRRFQR
ncbi:MAG: hypothetical protein OXM61_05430 [Candidatus Poribacteria bacterium]|nr:hypothetical protein [Candidatus Poribacteria bacterium]